MAAVSNTSAPPPYSKVARPTRPTPEITILLLGSPGVGKSTFLATLPQVRGDGARNVAASSTRPKSVSSSPPPNPSSFSVTLFNRPYNIVTYRSESTLFIDPFPSKVDFVIFCYAVDSRESLYNCQFYWRKQFADRYERQLALTVPVMLLGLKRDLRTDEKIRVSGTAAVAHIGGQEVGTEADGRSPGNSEDIREQYRCVMPEEGVKAAQEMSCDKYVECSALTGELMWEALEDITRTAALTTTEKGGLTESQCHVM